MNWQGYGWPPTGHDHTPTLLQAILDLKHSSGRIEATLEHIGGRLEDGDQKFTEISADVKLLRDQVSDLKTASPHQGASKIESARKLAEVAIPAIKEAWPFLAVAGAGTARAFGYDLSWLVGQ